MIKKEVAKEKTNILDLKKYQNARIIVKLAGGREVRGTLVGFDHLMNLVLDDTTELLRDCSDPGVLSGRTRHLGLIVVRGNQLLFISPADGIAQIDNPFGNQ